MEIFNPKTLQIKFTKTFKFVGILSIALCVLSFIAMAVFPKINYGIDFRGGIEAQLAFQDSSIKIENVRTALSEKIPKVQIVEVASEKNEFFVTAPVDSSENVPMLFSEILNKSFGVEGKDWTISKLDSVGPKIGSELRKAALLSLIYTCILIALYIYWRFDLRYAPGALLSIFHDLVLTAGFLSIARIEFSTSVVAALLTLAGYSINDTVVVFDRIREIEGKLLGKARADIVDFAINSTLSRTIITSGTTLLSIGVLWFAGGPALKSFSITLFFGVCVGTYSSVFVASPLYLKGHKWFGNEGSLSKKTA